jgi:predicted small secreted protein
LLRITFKYLNLNYNPSALEKGSFMKMRIVALLLAISMIMLFVSGCTDTSGTGEEIDEGAPKVGSASDVVELEQVPAGFEQLGVRELEANEVLDGLGSEDTVNTATQGIYKNAANVEIHVNAIECTDTEAAQTMVDDYKLSKLESTERDDVFTEHSFNDHFATRIIWYVTDGGEEVPRYAYIWNTDNIVIQVRGTTSDPNLLLSFAQATGY